MAYQISSFEFTLVAATNLSGNQFYAVAVNASGDAVLATDGASTVGILQNDPESGESAAVMQHGITKAAFGAVVAPGDILAVDASGALVPATTGDREVGTALEGGASGEIGTVLLGSQNIAP